MGVIRHKVILIGLYLMIVYHLTMIGITTVLIWVIDQLERTFFSKPIDKL